MGKILPSEELGNLITKFVKDFYDLTGVNPIISYPNSEKEENKVNLWDLETLVNDVFYKHFPDLYDSKGIRSRNRKRIRVTFRQIYMKMAVQEYYYSLSRTANHLGFDHATVIHAKRTINNLLQTNDKDTVLIYNLIKNAEKERFRNDGDVQQNDGRELVTKSILSSVLYEGKYISNND